MIASAPLGTSQNAPRHRAGVAVLDRAGEALEAALRRADAALYEATKLLAVTGAWERYVAALRVVDRS